MDHSPYTRIVPGSPTAVVLIHGIVGTPRRFDGFLPLLPADCSVYSLLLTGHGGSVRDFSAASMKEWRRQVSTLLDALAKEYRDIYLIGHSMGTLLSLEQSLRHPQAIRGMLLLACPLKIRVTPSGLRKSLLLALNRISPDDPWLAAARAACGVTSDWRLWHYLGWVPRLVELLLFSREMRKAVSQVTVPAVALQCGRDELVSRKSESHLIRNPNFTVEVLPQSRHDYHPPGDMERVNRAVAELIHL